MKDSIKSEVSVDVLKSIAMLVFLPRSFIPVLEKESGYRRALLLWSTISIVSMFISVAILATPDALSTFDIVSLIISTLLSPLLPIIIVHNLLKLVKGRGLAGDTSRAYLYSSVPITLLTTLTTPVILLLGPSAIYGDIWSGILVILGSSVVFIYSFVLPVWFLSAVHKLHPSKVIVAFIVPFLIGDRLTTFVIDLILSPFK